MLTFALKKKRTPSIAPKRHASTTSTMTHSMHVQRAKVRHILRGPTLQPKLTIGQPNDKYEQEADRVADEVMRMPEPGVQRQVKPEEEEEETLQPKPLVSQITQVQRQEEEPSEEEEEQIQPKPVLDQITPLVQTQVEEEEEEPIEELEEEQEPIMTKGVSGRKPQIRNDLQMRLDQNRGLGQPLPKADRSFMERNFGVDLSTVRVHTDSNAIQMSRELNAQAFTHGRDIYFGDGKYSTATSSGKKLLAHELTHFVQQQCRSLDSHSLQMAPDDETQSWGMDVLGWIGDLIRVLGWATLAGGEESGRASLHLLHNMFGAGEPITVPREWIMASPSWRQGYEELLENWVSHVGRNAALSAMGDENEGAGHLSESSELQALPDTSCMLPWCEEADQFWGSGWATFMVEGDYIWQIDPSGFYLEVEMFNIVGSYHDRYRWEHIWDPGQHSREERGWYTPFDLTATWNERERFEQFSRVQVYALPIALEEDSEEESLEVTEMERALEESDWLQ